MLYCEILPIVTVLDSSGSMLLSFGGYKVIISSTRLEAYYLQIFIDFLHEASVDYRKSIFIAKRLVV